MESTVLVKAFAIMEGLANVGGESSLAELALQTSQTKPTVHRILKSLEALAYVERGEQGRYRLTEKLRRLSFNQDERILATLAQPLLQRLHETTSETVNLGILRSNRVVYLSVIESRHQLRRVAHVNETDPLLCTALGRAIASQLPEATLAQLIATTPLERRTPHTVTDAAELRKILRRAKAAGYAIERDQTDLGVTCIGAPILDDGRVAGAISISAPSARADSREQAWAKNVMQAAKSLGRLLAARRRRSA
jgi:DNA-binding IclR family transcriptional regulator